VQCSLLVSGSTPVSAHTLLPLVIFLIIVYACSSLLIGSIGLWLLVFFLMLMALIPHNVFLILFTFIGSIAAILTAIGLFNALLPMSSH
jgi:hypothetical protein